MAEPDKPPEDDALKSLRRRVDAARAQGVSPSPEEPPNAASLALRMGGEFGAAVLVGAAIGFGIDHLAPTSPFGLVCGLVLGFAAGVTNVVRAAQAYSRQNPVDPQAASIPDDEED
jgi:ATP synthase protein I